MTSEHKDQLKGQNPLGQSVKYISQYQPDLLFAIARQEKREEIGMTDDLPFSGEDIWNAYELSWLNLKGVPKVAIAEFRVPATSPNIVESKSLKLYLNSFNQTKFRDQETVRLQIKQDLEKNCLATVEVKLIELGQQQISFQDDLKVKCIDDVDITIDSYQYDANLLIPQQPSEEVSIREELLCSHLLKSNCLITSQPDWATVYIKYKGPAIQHSQLLAYLVSFRNHNEFHEQCVERIFNDLMTICKPEKLTVYARYTRRGGLDINPWRSNFETSMPNSRLIRQ